MRALLLSIPLLACLAAGPALACKIVPPGTPEQEARRALNHQTDRMEQATAIFVVEVVDVRSIPVEGSPFNGSQVTLRPVRPLHGPISRRSLVLRHDGYTTCGLAPMWGIMNGRRGERWVVFATATEPTQADVIETIRPEDVRPPSLRVLLAP